MICPHDTNQNQYCRDCGGSALCQKHKKQYCKMCDPIGYLFNNVRARINGALKKAQISKTNRTIGYLGCTIYFYKEYLEGKFKEEMTWENHGQGVGNWNIDHVIPRKSEERRGEAAGSGTDKSKIFLLLLKEENIRMSL